MTSRIGLGRAIPSRAQFVHQITSARQLEALNATGGIAVGFTTPGRIAPGFAIAGLQSPQLSIWATRSVSGFTTRPRFEAELLTVRFIDHGSMLRREGRREHVAFADTAMLVAFDTMLTEEASGDFAALSATVTRSVLAAGHDALLGREDGFVPDFEPVIPADTLPIRVLRRTLERVFSRARILEPDDLVLSLLEEILVYQILSSWPRRPPAVGLGGRPCATSLSVLQRAIGYIEENLARRFALSEVAAAVGISVRSLQLTFRRELDVTPVSYIIDRRLKAVHDDLRNSGLDQLTVTQVARRWGFTHQGDFGQRFKERFGVSPSDLRRSGPTPATALLPGA